MPVPSLRRFTSSRRRQLRRAHFPQQIESPFSCRSQDCCDARPRRASSPGSRPRQRGELASYEVRYTIVCKSMRKRRERRVSVRRAVVSDCPKFSLPPGTADKLEACCWNESQGCTFIGSLQAVLTHYEEHCVFHVVSCPRCNGSVLQQDLPRHYRAGCHGEAISSSPEQPTLVQGLVLRPAGDTETSLDELKALPRDPYQDKLPEIQRKLDEVLEETKNIGTQVEELTKTFRGREDRLTRALEELSTTFSQELRSQLHELPACARDMPNVGRNTNGEAGMTSANDMPWSLEKKHVLRKLELLATDSQAYLEFLRQRSDQHLHQPAAEYEPFILYSR
ncbi:hypothetical protein HPB48_014638 [Haemaphysalis longicornis]|uniref:HD-GYP domain-containing protein n=1 Tax=Haemaphysalis longicornis TaxID=44386 RepID=A0A9J6GKL2_HAELO|nr:hypothetical protein HPB48_014638 [Haemaphysalis longicornis]